MDIPITFQEDFVNSLYSSVDAAIARGLDRLRVQEGIIPTCKSGCSYCCRHYILTNRAEAHTLAQYIKREWSKEQIALLRKRTQNWHKWDRSRLDRTPSADIDREAAPHDYEPCCPLLENELCSAYRVRPFGCRIHYVRSHPLSCSKDFDPASEGEAPVVLTSIISATEPFATAMKEYIEATGIEFTRSIMLLPHWLAIEMDWDFALSF